MATQGRYVSEIVSKLSSPPEGKERPQRVSVTSPERSLSPWSPGGSREDLKSPTGRGRRSPWDASRSGSLDSRGGVSYYKTRRSPWSPDDSDSQESTSSRKSSPWVTQLRSSRDQEKDSSVKRSQSIDYGPNGKKKVSTESFPFGRRYLSREKDRDKQDERESNAPRRTVSMRSSSAVNEARRAFFSPPRDRETEESIINSSTISPVSPTSPTKQTLGTTRPRSPYRPSGLSRQRSQDERGREKSKSPKAQGATSSSASIQLSSTLGHRSNNDSKISSDDPNRQKSRLSQQILRGAKSDQPQHKTEKLEPQLEWQDSGIRDDSSMTSSESSQLRRSMMSPVSDLMSVSEVSETSSTDDNMASSTMSQDSWVSNGTNKSGYTQPRPMGSSNGSQPVSQTGIKTSYSSRPSSYCESYEERIFTPERAFSPSRFAPATIPSRQGSQSSLDRPQSRASSGSHGSRQSLERSQRSVDRSQTSLERSLDTSKPPSSQGSLERPRSGSSYSSHDRHLSPDRASTKTHSRPSSSSSQRGPPPQESNTPGATDSESGRNNL